MKNLVLCALERARRLLNEKLGSPGVGFSCGQVDSSGELELFLDVAGAEGKCWLSEEMWRAMGEKAGWITNIEQPICSHCHQPLSLHTDEQWVGQEPCPPKIEGAR